MSLFLILFYFFFCLFADEKSHMCEQCGKRFKLKWALTVHNRSHIRLRPHKCLSCARTFVNAKDLHRHELIHSSKFNVDYRHT